MFFMERDIVASIEESVKAIEMLRKKVIKVRKGLLHIKRRECRF